ncbi:hypothetical protein BHT95_00400 [Bacillus paralicheniformis]|nr:hypothetical protein BHT95_00400 [Bacillus paralicheniformis]TWM68429.1 hypothetical protein CHCC14814_0431 [Bacillus paralicheniformis]
MPKENHNAKTPENSFGVFLIAALKKLSPRTENSLFSPGYSFLINQKTYKLIETKQIPPLFPLSFALI